MTNVAIRPALETDLEQLVRLNSVIQRLHADLEPSRFRSHTVAADVSAFFSSAMSKPANAILIAERDGQALGYLWFERQDRPETTLTLPRSRFYVHHVVVDLEARRSGVATALFERVELAAREAGCEHIALDTWSANAAAHAFFSARGYAPINVILEKRL